MTDLKPIAESNNFIVLDKYPRSNSRAAVIKPSLI